MPIINSLGTLTYPKIYYYSLPSGSWINLLMDNTNALKNFPIPANINVPATTMFVDNAYNTYVTSFTIPAQAAGRTYTYASTFNSGGTNTYYKYFTNATGVELLGIQLDSSGNTYVVGVVTRVVGSNNYPSVYVVKFDSTGTIQWENQYYTSLNNDTGLGFELDSNNDLYIIGSGFVSGGRRTGELLKISGSTGLVTWAKNISRSVSVGILDSAMDSNNNTYLVLKDSSATPIYAIQKINSSGTSIWQKNINTPITSICTVGNNIAVSTIIGIIVLDSNGTIIAQKAGLSLSGATDSRICSDSSNNLYIISVGNDTISATPYYTAITAFNSSYNTVWSNKLVMNGADAIPTLTDILPNGAGNINLTFALGQYNAPNYSMWVYNVPSDGTIPKNGSYTVGSYSIAYQSSSIINTTTSYTSITGSDFTIDPATFTRQTASLTNGDGSNFWTTTLI